MTKSRSGRGKKKLATDSAQSKTISLIGEGQLLSGRYRVIEKIGTGGMGIVYKAKDEKLDDRVFALKALPPDMSTSKAAIKRLKKEALAAIDMHHPNIMALHSFDNDGPHHFLVMEFLHGPDLEDALVDEERFAVEAVLDVARQVCPALDYAHKRGIVHRDIKPSNLIYKTEGDERVIKIADFGIAYQVRNSIARLTGQDTTSGTMHYMPPEQLAGKDVDGRADQYALAATLYELLRGRPPFEGAGVMLMKQIEERAPDEVDGVPPHINAALLKGLAKKADDRYESCGKLLEALEARPYFISESENGVERTIHVDPAQMQAEQDKESTREPAERVIEINSTGAIGDQSSVPVEVTAVPLEELAEENAETAEQVAEQAEEKSIVLTIGSNGKTIGDYDGSETVNWSDVSSPDEGSISESIYSESELVSEKQDDFKTVGLVLVTFFCCLFVLVGWVLSQGTVRQSSSSSASRPRKKRMGPNTPVEVQFSSIPPGAKVFCFGMSDPYLGRTDVSFVRKFKPAKYRFKFANLKGYQERIMDFEVRPNRRNYVRGILQKATASEKAKPKKSVARPKKTKKTEIKRPFVISRKPRNPKPGDEWTVAGIEFCWCPPGEFMMGSPSDEPGRNKDEGPQHKVKISKGFWLSKYEITQLQWEAVMGNNPSQYKGPKRPVEYVSWYSCRRFTEKLTKSGADKVRFRIPSEAEWEYACRAGTKSALYSGAVNLSLGKKSSSLEPIAWYASNSREDDPKKLGFKVYSNEDSLGSVRQTHPVGEKKGNAWGLHDMIGNVCEWTNDWYSESYYSAKSKVDPLGPSSGEMRVIRGGSWSDEAKYCRSAARNWLASNYAATYLGLRLLMEN